MEIDLEISADLTEKQVELMKRIYDEQFFPDDYVGVDSSDEENAAQELESAGLLESTEKINRPEADTAYGEYFRFTAKGRLVTEFIISKEA